MVRITLVSSGIPSSKGGWGEVGGVWGGDTWLPLFLWGSVPQTLHIDRQSHKDIN